MAELSGAEVAFYTRQVNVRIEEAQHQKLRELDVAEGKGRSELVREAIELLLALRRVMRVRQRPRVLKPDARARITPHHRAQERGQTIAVAALRRLRFLTNGRPAHCKRNRADACKQGSGQASLRAVVDGSLIQKYDGSPMKGKVKEHEL